MFGPMPHRTKTESPAYIPTERNVGYRMTEPEGGGGP